MVNIELPKLTNKNLGLIAIIGLQSCSHPQQSVPLAELVKPGQIIAVCGRKSGTANFLISKNSVYSVLEGLSVLDHGPTQPSDEKYMCVTGEISYLGCESRQILCTDAAYDYAIKITSIYNRK